MDPNMLTSTAVDQTIWLSGIVEHVMQIVNHPGNSKLHADRLVVQDFSRRTGKLASEVVEKLRKEQHNVAGFGDDVVAKVARKQEKMNEILRELLDGLTMDKNRRTSVIRIKRSRVSSGSFEPALRDAEEWLRETADGILATMHEPSQKRTDVHILSLCGDGIRVLSQLLILRDIMEQIGQLEDHIPLPCKYFDLVVGTGTGAIAAIFLGRLEMTVQEAISAFCKIFGAASTTVSGTSTSIDLDKFATHMKAIVQEHLGDPLALMSNPSDCKTLVFAARRANLEAPPEPFRSFRTLNASASAFRIADVAAAACAPPDRPVLLGSPPASYTNAALFGHSNPTQLAIDEAERLWNFSDIKLVLCISTGARAVVDVGDGNWKLDAVGRELASSGDPIHDRVFGNSKKHFMYDRLQVNQGLEDIATDHRSLDKPIGRIAGVTQGYLRFKQTEHATSAFARALYNGDRIHENIRESTSRINDSHSCPTNPTAVQPRAVRENVESPDILVDMTDAPYAESAGFAEGAKSCLPGTRGVVLLGMDTVANISTKQDVVALVSFLNLRRRSETIFFFIPRGREISSDMVN